MHKSVSKQPLQVTERFEEVLDPVRSLVPVTGRPTFHAAIGYGTPTGSTGNTNMMLLDGETFEYHIKGTQTILAPVFSADGLNVGMDQTNNDGVEITEGITARSKAARVTGTDKFFVELTLSVQAVAGTNACFLGFRKAQAYQAALASYEDFAGLNIDNGTINFVRRLGTGSVVTTATGATLADTGTVTLRVEVRGNRTVRLLVNGVDVTPAGFTFANAQTLVPTFFFLNNTTTAGAVNWKRYESNLLY